MAEIALGTLYAPGQWLGRYFGLLGLKVAYAHRHRCGTRFHRPAVGGADVQPVLADLDRELEEAAATLGASRRQSIFRVILRRSSPLLLTGLPSLARAIGEYSSVIFIAGNTLSFRNRAVAHRHSAGRIQLRWGDRDCDDHVAISFTMLLVINLIQTWSRRRFGYGG